MEQQVTLKLDTFKPPTKLVIVERKQVVIIPYTDITRIKKRGKAVTVFTQDKFYGYPLGLEKLLKDLPVNLFARVHPSHVISIDHLYLLEGTVPFSKIYKKELETKLGVLLDQHYRQFSFTTGSK